MHHEDGCLLCERVQACADGQYPYLIEEFRHSFLMLGEHQYFKGYCVVVLKDHARDMMDLPGKLQIEVLQEVMFASRAIQLAFNPWKLNHASLGNQVTHVHWHIFPRYADEPDLKQHPWFHADRFSQHVPDAATAQATIGKIRERLSEAGLWS